MDMQPHEIDCAVKAGKMAGEYLESIGKTDLAELTQIEWQTFCEVICGNYATEITKLLQSQ